MRPEAIEKAGVAGLMWGSSGAGDGGRKRKILRRQHAEKFKRPGYKIAQHAGREDSMLCSRIGTLILFWVAEAPQRPTGDVPAIEMKSWEDGSRSMDGRTSRRFKPQLAVCLFACLSGGLLSLPLRAQEPQAAQETQQTTPGEPPKPDMPAAKDREVSWRTLPRNFSRIRKRSGSSPHNLPRGGTGCRQLESLGHGDLDRG